jgi:hypothetical protein
MILFHFPDDGSGGFGTCTATSCNYYVRWVYSFSTDNITFTLKSSLTGDNRWMGIGFSNDRAMVGY